MTNCAIYIRLLLKKRKKKKDFLPYTLAVLKNHSCSSRRQSVPCTNFGGTGAITQAGVVYTRE